MFNPATGERLRPLTFHDVDQLETVTRLRSLTELPTKLETHMRKIDELKDRLALPETQPLPMPSAAAEVDEFANYQASVNRAEADKRERSEARGLLAIMKGRGGGCGPRMLKALNSCRDELVSEISEAMTAKLKSKTSTEQDADDWAFLGRVYVMLVNLGMDNDRPMDIRPYHADIIQPDGNGRVTIDFIPDSVRIPWSNQAVIFAHPANATAGTVIDPAIGIPALSDIRLLAEAGFRLMSFTEVVALARFETAKRYACLLSDGRAKISPAIADYLTKQVATKGEVSTDSLWS
jgi:hypothetical protein